MEPELVEPSKDFDDPKKSNAEYNITKVKDTYPTINSFINKMRTLLQRQQLQERRLFQEMTSNKSPIQIQEQGAGLANMQVLASRDGLYDKIIVTLCKNLSSVKNPISIPQHCKLTVGDDVAIYHNNTNIAEGVIYKRTNEKIKVSINTDPQENQDFQGLKVNIVMKWNQVTYRRYNKALQQLSDIRNHNQLTDLLFTSTARGYKTREIEERYFNEKMNEKQNQAVSQSLAQTCHLIHGPPGTGKTTTVCHLIGQAVNRGQKVLACAPSNIAVDNIVEGILSKAKNCVRIGNPSRIIPQVMDRCLDYLVSQQESNWKSEEKKLHAAQKKVKRANNKAEKKQIIGEIKGLRKQIQNLQEQVITQILSDADVICCTNAGAADRVFKRYLNKRIFDLVVIDQCGQGLQVSCWIPLMKGRRAVLAGDHKQLPPTVKFQQQSLLSYTLFSRAMEELKYISSTMLQVQYRMNKQIMGWSNMMFYNNLLKAHSSVQNHQLRQIYQNVDDEEAVLMFLDTAGCQVGQEGGQMESKMNIGEADIIVNVCQKIMKYGVKPKDIAILTPYSKQVTLIKNILLQKISQNIGEIPEVSTVDGIQGREKQCILISLVRSNPSKEVGFLKDWRRMNVAVTRARRMLMIVGDSDTVAADPKIASLYEWFNKHGNVQSAQQLRYVEDIRFGRGKITTFDNIEKKQPQKGEKKKKQQSKKNKNKTKNDNKNEEPKKKEQKYNISYHTEQQKQENYNQYKKILCNLPAEKIFINLSAYERMIVHQVAQQLGFEHFTSQDKQKITVRNKDRQQQIHKDVSEENEIQQEIEPKKKKKQPKKVQNIAQLIGSQSQQEQQKHQKPIKIIVPQQKEYEESKSQKIVDNKQKKNKKKKKKQEEKKQEEDWEKLLEEFEKDIPKKDQCFKCLKKITSVTAAQCRFCNYWFCRYDLLAQEHGCEEAARQKARLGNLDRFIEKGSLKIQEKIRQQEQKRQRKPKESKQTKQTKKK